MGVEPDFDAPVSVPVGEDLRGVLAASRIGTWRWDAATGVVRWDETLERLSGLEPGGFGSNFEAWIETLHPDEVDSILAKVNDAIERRGSYHFEHRTRWPDGSEHWLECRGQVTTDDAGAFTGTVGCAVDVTDRRRAEDERGVALDRERRLSDRLEFLSRLTEAAISVDDHLDFMQAAAAAAVPMLGDWCSLHFVPEPGDDVEAVVVHSDPDRARWADELRVRFPRDPEAHRGVSAVMRTGRTEFIPQVTAEIVDEALDRRPNDASDLREILDALGLTSVITVPLHSSRGVIGAMQFVTAESGRIYDADDVALAQVAAGRIADALDNTWLAEQHRHISATLQRSLLPPKLPVIPGLDVAARYWPAGAEVEAGGDFYDLFRRSSTSWSLLIGDVCGTGPDAAAVTGITRHTVRAAARHGHDHRAVLEWLNEALLLSDRDRFCTAVYATLDQRKGRWQLASCAAGHPRPIVVSADGSARLLGRPGTLLGVLDDMKLDVVEAVLDVGDVVVFYTDGITDLRPPHDRTEEDVVALLGSLATDRSAEQIAEAIDASLNDELGGAERRDDVALLVLRVVDTPI
ncbi:MAG TPA: SpoIIE family protein phosphatase [Microthrixaceae bacterium]|nr:SpoIIE family protein phosphatase [Microthrixaceae bacterium]